jgi:hypothetical protein
VSWGPLIGINGLKVFIKQLKPLILGNDVVFINGPGLIIENI